MFDWARRVLGLEKRSLTAAGTGRRWLREQKIANLNQDIAAGGRSIQQRASWFARNNSHAVSGVSAIVSHVVGTGIKPVSQHSNPRIRERIHEAWNAWVDEADADGRGDFYALQELACRSMVESGEAIIRFRQRNPSDGLTIPLQLQLLHPDHLPFDRSTLDGSPKIVSGVEFDALGKRVAYHLLRSRPGDTTDLRGQLEPVRVAAADVVHLFQQLEAGQVRGVSWLQPVLQNIRELGGFYDAALARARVSALLVGALTDMDGSNTPPMPGTDEGDGTFTGSLEPGAILNLPPSKRLDFYDPKPIQDFDEQTKGQLRAIAAGLGVPYELLSGDLRDVNYSSIRAGLVEFKRRVEAWQYNTVVHQFLRPVWERFIRLLVLTGQLSAAQFERNPRQFLRCEWLAPKMDWVDPSKDADAEIKLIGAGLKSRSQSIAERGYDPEQVDAEIALDREREARLGLSFSTTASAPAAATAPADQQSEAA